MVNFIDAELDFNYFFGNEKNNNNFVHEFKVQLTFSFFSKEKLAKFEPAKTSIATLVFVKHVFNQLKKIYKYTINKSVYIKKSHAPLSRIHK